MDQFPSKLNGADVVCFTSIDDRHTATKNFVHRVKGLSNRPVEWLAIGKHFDDEGYYLFYGIGVDTIVADTFHESVKSAIDQAEFEYKGTSSTWNYLN